MDSRTTLTLVTNLIYCCISSGWVAISGLAFSAYVMSTASLQRLMLLSAGVLLLIQWLMPSLNSVPAAYVFLEWFDTSDPVDYAWKCTGLRDFSTVGNPSLAISTHV